jgi:hypothetical protein
VFSPYAFACPRDLSTLEKLTPAAVDIPCQQWNKSDAWPVFH